jgi:hypothetical protein
VSALKGLVVLDWGFEVNWFDGKKMTIMAFAFSFLGICLSSKTMLGLNSQLQVDHADDALPKRTNGGILISISRDSADFTIRRCSFEPKLRQ